MHKAARLISPVARRFTHTQHVALNRIQKANIHDVSVKLRFEYDNVETLIGKVQQAGGSVVSQKVCFETYYDSVAADERLHQDDQNSVDLNKFEPYRLSQKDTWLYETKIATPKKFETPLAELRKSIDEIPQSSWICKAPSKDTSGKVHVGAKGVPAHFQELHGAKEIRRELNLQQDITKEAREGVKLPTLEQDLKERFGVVPFAQIFFKQSVYHLPNHFVLSLYESDFDLKLGILETVIQNATELDVNNRSKQLEKFIEELQISPQKYIPDLIKGYLALNKPKLHAHLVQHKIVPQK